MGPAFWIVLGISLIAMGLDFSQKLPFAGAGIGGVGALMIATAINRLEGRRW